ncbi:hypothetical protein OMEGA_152 [Klebsiella phage vB_KaeM_KaOmega]|nr:hypothetical protein OMEGA_152 [Klebsiella phage vB_KaeM_KaOmega]
MNIINTVNANEIKEISVTGKRWFQRSAGNTYHSVSLAALVSVEVADRLGANQYGNKSGDVWIDLAYVGFAYGYERGFEQTALSAMIEAVKDSPAAWRKMVYACQAAADLGVVYTDNVYDVSRKKDL